MSLWWSFSLTAVGVVGLVLVFARPRSIAGPVVGLVVQTAWIAYAVSSAQWWFIASAVAYSAANIYGIRQRLRARRPVRLAARKVGPDGRPIGPRTFTVAKGFITQRLSPEVE